MNASRALAGIVGIALCLAPLSAEAADDAMDKAMGEIVGCYAYAATTYGSAKCDPPPMLLSAVRGKCSTEEAELRNLFFQRAQPSLDRAVVADTAMNVVTRKYDPIIQSWILDSQIKTGGCQHPGG